MNNLITKITDQELLKLCDKFGKQALLWRRKFMGLLPEVHRRKLYKKRGCASIFEFAAKWAGISEKQTKIVLRLEERFEDKPVLKNLLVEGSVSVNKLARVVSIATVENESELADKIKRLPRAALETFVRDEGEAKSLHVQKTRSEPEGRAECKPERSEGFPCISFSLSAVVITELNRLYVQGHDVNKIILELLKQRNEKIEEEKEKIAKNAPTTVSRYIPVRVKAILKEEFGQKCSIPNCPKLARNIHHSQRFALAHRHDPRYMAPLCREHHQLAHIVDLRYEEKLKIATP
jgi:hypothetical protein